ncbi:MULTISPECIES: hypothetical protein [unclassified Coleofasciculus]|uniref:hypothetical protein n=1 Tax=unclassified Coleofasciculus TaxID=2692782 RepID=UPI0019E9EBF6|nr:MULTISPECIES: hypothetical protein [unclassified Coleofasciculus]MBE9129593.1 hypothetical protein [Coleofasciculus sp. LEGE 07081]MBE9152146.1 hypothetical protein [Coleofasciculus sp. LEGE 07092]
MTMKNGQCRSCGSFDIRSNRNRKFPALNTMTLGLGNSSARYAALDTYVCVNCGYVESYVASPEDLNYIQDNWESVGVKCENTVRSRKNSDQLPPRHDEHWRTQTLHS